MIAREMLTTYGFSAYKFDYRKMSEDASRLVDMEIDKLVDMCYKEALAILSTNRRQLDLLKDKLLEEEIVDGQWVYDLVCGKCKLGRSVELDSLDFD